MLSVVIDNVEEAQVIAKKLLQNYSVLGFDTESCENKVSLIQLADKERAWLFRVNKIGMPSSLKKLLTQPDLIKIGIGLDSDNSRLDNMFGFHLKGYIDISLVALSLGYKDRSLQDICRRLGLRCPKEKHLGDWNIDKLTSQQIRYASMDAHLSYVAYYQLIGGQVPSINIEDKPLEEEDLRIAMGWIIQQLNNSPNPRTITSLVNQMANSYKPWVNKWLLSKRKQYAREVIDLMMEENQVIFDIRGESLSLPLVHDEDGVEEVEEVPEFFICDIQEKLANLLAGLSKKSYINMIVNGYSGWSKYPKSVRERWAFQIYDRRQ
jgi:hypothetical protein